MSMHFLLSFYFWSLSHFTGTPPWLLRPVRDAKPCQRSPTLIPREAEDFPRGGNHSKDVPLPTCLA